MKSIFTLILLFPLLLFGQDIAMATNISGEKFELKDPIDINKNNKRFPNTGTKSDMSTLPSMMGCSEMIIEFDSGAGLMGPENCGGIANGFILLAYSEELYNLTSVGPGAPISASSPTVSGFHLTRNTDEYSAQFRSLLITGETIPYIELSVYPNTGSANPRQFNRYENCIITSISGGGSGGENITTENISFTFTKACYISNELDFNTGGTILSSTDACVDLSLIDQSTCSCD